MKTAGENQAAQRKQATLTLCPPQVSHEVRLIPDHEHRKLKANCLSYCAANDQLTLSTLYKLHVTSISHKLHLGRQLTIEPTSTCINVGNIAMTWICDHLNARSNGQNYY
jgi:hypothetical protein